MEIKNIKTRWITAFDCTDQLLYYFDICMICYSFKIMFILLFVLMISTKFQLDISTEVYNKKSIVLQEVEIKNIRLYRSIIMHFLRND